MGPMTPLLLALLVAAPTKELSKPSEFTGRRLLIANYYTPSPSLPLQHVPAILKEMGFTVEIAQNPPLLPDLEGVDQLWLISGAGTSLNPRDIAALREYVRSGKGLYVLADNTPYTRQMNDVASALHGFTVSGHYNGMKMVTVMSRGEIERLIEDAKKKGDYDKLAEYRRAGYFNGTFYAEDHELLTGIEQIYEGGTICHPSRTAGLNVILSASNNLPLVFLPNDKKERIVYDCGWTRLYYQWKTHEASSEQWYQNVAAYLMGKRRKDLDNL